MRNLNDDEYVKAVAEKIPKRYLVKTEYKDYEIDPQKLENQAKLKDFNMYIWGGVGSGKTQLIADFLANIIWDTRTYDPDPNQEEQPFHGCARFYYQIYIKFYNAIELMVYLRSLFNDSDYDLNDFLDSLKEYKYFVIDDLGSEKQSEWVIETFYLLINKMYEDQRPRLIITSNKSLQEIAASLGDRIASRIAEMCEVVKLEGKDRRLIDVVK